ncbi:hypothetical protein OIO90_000794 [Microbotryomycetes sp. JL221]|nr:hypothetical protein OIO90_000794 [Microbotryomycetes sp. JL221]
MTSPATRKPTRIVLLVSALLVSTVVVVIVTTTTTVAASFRIRDVTIWNVTDYGQAEDVIPVRNDDNEDDAQTPETFTCAKDDSIEREYGRINVQLSRDHVGTQYRLARLFQRARLERNNSNQRFKIGVLGGSVSSGHGNSHSPNKQDRQIEQPWWTFVRNWFEQLPEFKDRIELVNGAQPAVDSTFFKWCWTEKLGGQDFDLVFLETAVNDDFSRSSMNDAEDLLRSLLELPQNPSVVYVDAFALHSGHASSTAKPKLAHQVSDDKSQRHLNLINNSGMLDGADSHLPLARFYDVPEISARNAVLPTLLNSNDPDLEQQLFKGDTRHIASPLHQYLGLMVVRFLQDVRCHADKILKELEQDRQAVKMTTRRGGRERPSSSSLSWTRNGQSWIGSVPRIKISQPFDSPSIARSVAPVCHLAGSSLEPSTTSPDWSVFTWRYDKHYLQSLVEHATIEFRIKVEKGAKGLVAISFLRSKQYELGNLKCRILGIMDQDVVLQGWWDKTSSVSETVVVASELQDDMTYTLACETERDDQGRTAFRIMAIHSL